MKQPAFALRALSLALGHLVVSAVCLTPLRVEAAAPAVPEIISVAEGSSTAAQPVLTWISVTNPSGGTPHYKLYRVKANGTSVLVTTVTDGTLSATDTTPPDPDDGLTTSPEPTDDALIDNRHGTYSYCVASFNPVTSEESAMSAPAYYGFRRTPFVLKWDDDRYSPATDFRATSWPGGATEPPRVTVASDGVSLVANGQPIRFIGFNFAYGGCIPAKADAPKIAARLAQFGVNLVRLHNFDDKPAVAWVDTKGDANAANDINHNGHEGILKDPSKPFTGATDVDAVALDKLDFFIAELRKNFIYVDLNLRVGKDYELVADDPGTTSVNEAVAGRYKGIDLYYPAHITEQKAYATFLLGHENPHVSKPGGGNHTYASDPAIAFVETNNEDGFIGSWIGNLVDGGLHNLHGAELKKQWNDWLRGKYADTNALQTAWAPVTTTYDVATELLANYGFASGSLSPWQLGGTSQASTSIVALGAGDIPNPLNAVDINVTSATPSTPGNVHLLYTNSGAGIATDQAGAALGEVEDDVPGDL